jgi:hypothetical protein
MSKIVVIMKNTLIDVYAFHCEYRKIMCNVADVSLL